MTIEEVITTIKKYHKGTIFGRPIDDKTTRDQVLYGPVDVKCTGIVTTCFASARVIREAKKLGCNLIISHEALFWNHGDHTDWLADNEVFQAKKKLLDDCGVTVWRDHDYIHSGIPVGNGKYVDGIFTGLMKELGWENRLVCDPERPMDFAFDGVPVKNIASELIDKMNLNGTRIIGDPNTIVHNLRIVGHVDGRADNDILKNFEEGGFDAAITLELTDYTFNEYIRDAALLGMSKAIIPIGHFNVEEPGMKYMAEWLPDVIKNTRVYFVQSGDAYHYIKKY